MSEWVPAVPRMKDKLPANSMDMFQGDGMPIHIQVTAGIFVAFVAAFFLWIIYAMLTKRDVVYCDVIRFHKQLMAAILGARTERNGGRDLSQEGATARGGNSCRGAPLLEWITVQGDTKLDVGKEWRAKGPMTEHKLFKGPISIV